jgi:hypothetical protein
MDSCIWDYGQTPEEVEAMEAHPLNRQPQRALTVEDYEGMIDDGIAIAVCGCPVDLDGHCDTHDQPSVLIVAGLI